MKRHLRIAAICCLLFVLAAIPLSAETRVIVRTDSLKVLQSACLLLGCRVQYGLDGTLGKVFLLTAPDWIRIDSLLRSLLGLTGVRAVELDALGSASQVASGAPAGLWDRTPVNYFGNTVWRGYVEQPAAQIVRAGEAQKTYNLRGSGIVAVIDTGIDPTHPALKNVLVSGYDFTRNRDGMPAETGDLNQSTAAVVDGAQPAYVNQSTAAVVDQSTAAVVDNPEYAAFGHGTMVAGVIHLVAPKAMIMPLKAFRADGSGYTSDVLRGIYRSVQSNAAVINMSFSFTTYSQELQQAVNYAARNGVVCVASAGNSGKQAAVYPAALQNVISVASTTNDDRRSSFSNYGKGIVWLAAPGEGIITTYPFGSYAAAWGTSFSAPFVSGAAALMLDLGDENQADAASAVAKAQWISDELGNGRLDLMLAIAARRQALGQ